MNILGFFMMASLANASANQWVDPHDMNTNVKEKYTKSVLKKSSSTTSIHENCVTDPMPAICHGHLRRIVSVLMNSAHVDKKDSELYHGHIRFNINPDDFEFLINFAKEDLTLDRLRKLDTVLSESFKRTYIDEYLDTVETFQLKLYSLVVNIQNLWLLGALYLLYVVFQLLRNDFSFEFVLRYLLILLLIVDFGIRYRHLLEEAEEYNLNVVYSKDCDVSRMSWGEWTKYLFSGTECQRRVVTPIDAFLYQITRLIIVPMHAVGTGMGGFGKNLFTNLPWGLNLVMWPVLLIFTLLLFLFAMTVCTGQIIEFNLMHLLKLKFGGGSRENSLTGKDLEKLMEKALHRPMVQNVQNCDAPNKEPSGNSDRYIDSKKKGAKKNKTMKKCEPVSASLNKDQACMQEANLAEYRNLQKEVIRNAEKITKTNLVLDKEGNVNVCDTASNESCVNGGH